MCAVGSRNLGVVLSSPLFRRLFAVRITGQFCDGLFQSALATFVLFSPERQPTAASIASAFAILYLPFTLVGPFAGVALDVWNRRQVLLVGNLVRAVLVAGIALLTSAGHSGVDLGIAVLVALGINRFILAGLSAALPHTVPESSLVTANAFAPTAGTMGAAVGGLLGVALRSVLGGSDSGSTGVLLLAAAGLVVTALLALRMPRHSLGPEDTDVTADVRSVLIGLWSGVPTLWNCVPARRAVALVTAQRIALGGALVLVILLLRHTLNSPDNPSAALAQLTVVVGAAAGGALLGAVATPLLSPRIGGLAWAAICIIIAGLIAPAAVAVTTYPLFLLASALIGFAGQAAKVVADTEVQERIADDHRGRVFALYDIVINIGLVIGVTLGALTSEPSGRGPLTLVTIAVVLVGLGSWTLIRSRSGSPTTA